MGHLVLSVRRTGGREGYGEEGIREVAEVQEQEECVARLLLWAEVAHLRHSVFLILVPSPYGLG